MGFSQMEPHSRRMVLLCLSVSSYLPKEPWRAPLLSSLSRRALLLLSTLCSCSAVALHLYLWLPFVVSSFVSRLSLFVYVLFNMLSLPSSLSLFPSQSGSAIIKGSPLQLVRRSLAVIHQIIDEKRRARMTIHFNLTSDFFKAVEERSFWTTFGRKQFCQCSLKYISLFLCHISNTWFTLGGCIGKSLAIQSV